MVNALLYGLPFTLGDPEEDKLLISYVKQLHCFHGFETIFVPEETYNRIITIKPLENDYLRKLPTPQNTEDKLLTKIKHELDSILWVLKKTDYLEAQLGSFISLYSMWAHALSLKAVVVLPTISPTSSVSHFFHILVSDKRDFIGRLADDLELWFLSRFGVVSVRWPYYLNFTKQIEEDLSTEFEFKPFNDLRTEICRYPASRQEEQIRKKLLCDAIKFNRLLVDFSMANYSDNIILTPSTLGVSNKNLLAFEKLDWHFPKLMKILQEPILNSEGFVPCFVQDELYSLELIRRIQPLSLLGNAVNPLDYYRAFELGLDTNIDLALESFRKRLDINRTF